MPNVAAYKTFDALPVAFKGFLLKKLTHSLDPWRISRVGSEYNLGSGGDARVANIQKPLLAISEIVNVLCLDVA